MSFFVFKVFNVLLLAAVICASKTLDPPEGTETSEELLAKEKLMKLFRERERNIENYWTSMETPNMKPAASGHHKRTNTDIENGPAGERSKRHFLKETSEELLAKEKLMKLFRERERNIENYWTSMETPNMKPAASGHHKRADTDIEDGPAGERSKRHFLRNLFGGLFQHKHNHQQPAPQPVYQPPGINIL